MKLFVRLVFLFFIGILSTEAQDIKPELERADSLFNTRRYTQSYLLYEKIYRSGKATPAMLLKMAYSEEAQDNLGNALYYLHDYYRFTSDEKVVNKMQELAQVNGLLGYEVSEYQKFQKLVEDNRYIIYLILLAFSATILIMMYRKYQKHQEKSIGQLVSMILILLASIYVLNFSSENDKGLIMQDNVYIMEGPSAASELIEVIEQGHKVEILDQQDIWIKIKWRGASAFVRESNIKPIL